MQGNYSGVEVQLYLRNLSNFYITSTYVPTFIIVVIGYLVYFFPLANFNERVLVGLTGLLVEATFFSQVSACCCCLGCGCRSLVATVVRACGSVVVLVAVAEVD